MRHCRGAQARFIVRGEHWRMPGTHAAFLRKYEDEDDQDTRKTALTGRAVLVVFHFDCAPATTRIPKNVKGGSPGRRDPVCCSGYEVGRRRAIGVVAALPVTHARPRRWCDAGPLRRQSVTAAQKAGDEDRSRDSDRNQGQKPQPGVHNPQHPALSRNRQTSFINPDGQAGSPPPQCPPNLLCIRDRNRPRPTENPAPTGCRVRFCAGTTSRQRLASRTKCGPGSPGERDAVCCSGYEAGRRRAIGVVAALPASLARPRRWCDAGPLRRQSVTAAQKAGDENRIRRRVRAASRP